MIFNYTICEYLFASFIKIISVSSLIVSVWWDIIPVLSFSSLDIFNSLDVFKIDSLFFSKYNYCTSSGILSVDHFSPLFMRKIVSMNFLCILLKTRHLK